MVVNWTELDVERCQVLEEYFDGVERVSVRLRHPDAGRPKIFLKSFHGNHYWIGPKYSKFNDVRDGFIIKGFIPSSDNTAEVKVKK